MMSWKQWRQCRENLSSKVPVFQLERKAQKQHQILAALLMLALGCGVWMAAENDTDWLPGVAAVSRTGIADAESNIDGEAASGEYEVRAEASGKDDREARIPLLEELKESVDPLEQEELATASELDSNGMTWLEWFERLEYVHSLYLDLPSDGEACPLIDAPGTSGIQIGGYPMELFMISMAGETSGGSIIIGDKGRGYGLCQFDYRYDLMDFINWVYEKNPMLWVGFTDLHDKYEAGDPELINHEGILRGFQIAEYISRTDYALDQLEFMYRDYFEGTFRQMEAEGFSLEKRHIAVSAAILSININCGPKTALFLQELSPEMTDEEMLNRLYELRNTILKKNGKGTNKRYLVGEPQLAMDLLHGEVNVLSDLSYFGGVSWGAKARSYLGELLSEEEIQTRMKTLGPGMIGLASDSNVDEWSDLMSHLRGYDDSDDDGVDQDGRDPMKEIVLEDEIENPKTGAVSPESSDVSNDDNASDRPDVSNGSDGSAIPEIVLEN